MRTASRYFFGGEMNLNKQSWYVRWFFWSLDILDKFVGCDTWRYQKGTNLCHFMRVILIYAPLVLVLHLALYGAAIGVVTVLPVYLFGWGSYGKTLGFVAAGVFIWFVTQAILERRKITGQESIVAQSPKVVQASSAGPTFWQVVGEWLRAKKAKVCPLIAFNDSKGVTNV